VLNGFILLFCTQVGKRVFTWHWSMSFNISYSDKIYGWYGSLSYLPVLNYTYIPLTLYPRRGSRGISEFYQYLLAMRNTADATSGKPIAALFQFISGESTINPIVAFYDIHGGKREVLFFYFVLDTTQDLIII
jgi:hypothetical protein